MKIICKQNRMDNPSCFHLISKWFDYASGGVGASPKSILVNSDGG